MLRKGGDWGPCARADGPVLPAQGSSSQSEAQSVVAAELWAVLGPRESAETCLRRKPLVTARRPLDARGGRAACSLGGKNHQKHSTCGGGVPEKKTVSSRQKDSRSKLRCGNKSTSQAAVIDVSCLPGVYSPMPVCDGRGAAILCGTLSQTKIKNHKPPPRYCNHQ
uniref:Uncharacterized protein n=1 Tax=Knipowitschia caucasica TaxID=637954 RepID=A0AAV2K1K9_KNICA